MMKQAEHNPRNIIESPNESTIEMEGNIQSTQQPLSNAERQRRYREKRKVEKKKRKMNACTTFRQSSDVQTRQEQPQHDVQINKHLPKSSAERQRKYRKLLREQQQQQRKNINVNTELRQLQNVDQAALERKRHLNKLRQSRFRAKQRFEWHSTSSYQAQAKSESLQLNNQKDFEEFDLKCTQNAFDHTWNACNRLWFKKDLHTTSDNHIELLQRMVTKENTRHMTVSVPTVDPTMKYLVIDATTPNIELSPLDIKSEPDDDESNDDDDEPPDIKRKVIGSEVSLPFRSACVMSVTSLVSPSTNCNVPISVSEVKQEPCSMDQYLELSPLDIKIEPDNESDDGNEPPDIKRKVNMELSPLEIKIEPDDDESVNDDEPPDVERKLYLELSPLDIKIEPDNESDDGGDTDSEYESGAPGPSTKKKLRTEIVHKKCVTTISRQGFKPNESQSTDDELRRLKKAPKSSAERAREFRARKALLKQQNKQEQEPDEDTRSAGPSGDNQVPGPSEIRTIEKRAKSAEATRRWREKKRGNREKKQAKSAAQRMREYRQRKKLAKKIQLKQRSGQDIDQGPSTINSISAELARRGNSQSQEQTKSDDDKADDDDEPPYKIKKEVADNTPQIKKLMQIKSYKQE